MSVGSGSGRLQNIRIRIRNTGRYAKEGNVGEGSMTSISLLQNYKRKKDGKKIKRNLTRDDEGSMTLTGGWQNLKRTEYGMTERI
jgi:hypothetical protein